MLSDLGTYQPNADLLTRHVSCARNLIILNTVFIPIDLRFAQIVLVHILLLRRNVSFTDTNSRL